MFVCVLENVGSGRDAVSIDCLYVCVCVCVSVRVRIAKRRNEGKGIE